MLGSRMGTKTKKTSTKSKGPSGSSSAAKPSARRATSEKSTSRRAAGSEKSVEGAQEEPRRLGIRGAAPWAARHAAKHAAEARARAAEPPPPGSARATLRVPTGAEEIKAKVIDLHNAVSEIKTLRKNLPRNFFEVGLALREIQLRRLYEVRGFGTFDTFVDRELDIGKSTAQRLVRIVEVFQRERGPRARHGKALSGAQHPRHPRGPVPARRRRRRPKDSPAPSSPADSLLQ